MTSTYASEIPRAYYSFKQYNTKTRITTYWYQIMAVLERSPKTVLEVGKGSGFVHGYLSSLSEIETRVVDVNAALKPDIVGDVRSLTTCLNEAFENPETYDVVLCARVLHHLPVSDISVALDQLAKSARYAVLTLPEEILAATFAVAFTGTQYRTVELRAPSFVKKIARSLLTKSGTKTSQELTSGIWKLEDGKDGPTKRQFREKVEQHFEVLSDYRIPEVSSHRVFVLKSRAL